MTAKAIKVVQARIHKIAFLSHTMPKIIQVCGNQRSSARDLVKVIQMDPMLASKVLKMVNSAYFGLSQQVTSLNTAIILLGMDTVKNLALSSSIKDSFNFDKERCGVDSEEFWKYVVGTAVMCRLLGAESGMRNTDANEMFVIGLLHCIGKAILLQLMPEQYKEVLEKLPDEYSDLSPVEESVFETTHMGVGAFLAKEWKFPEGISDGIKNYRTPEKSGRRTTHILALSNALVRQNKIGFDGSYHAPESTAMIWSNFPVSLETAHELLKDRMTEELEKANSF